jgi:hypothetical protein
LTGLFEEEKVESLLLEIVEEDVKPGAGELANVEESESS